MEHARASPSRAAVPGARHRRRRARRAGDRLADGRPPSPCGRGRRCSTATKVAGIVGDALAEPEVSARPRRLPHRAGLRGRRRRRRARRRCCPSPLSGSSRCSPPAPAPRSTRGLDRVLANPDVQEVLDASSSSGPTRRAMQLLQGDGLVDGITVVDGAVTVNLLPLIGRGLDRLQELGLFSDLEMPDADRRRRSRRADRRARGGDRSRPPRRLRSARRLPERPARRRPGVAGERPAGRRARQAGGVGARRRSRSCSSRRRSSWPATGGGRRCGSGLGGAAAMVVVRSAVRRVEDDAPELADQAGRPGGDRRHRRAAPRRACCAWPA